MKSERATISIPESVTGAPVDSHRFLDALALAYHRAVAGRLRADPKAVVGLARENLARWLSGGSFDAGTAASLYEWVSILDHSTPEELLALITAETDEGQRLRQSSPFVGVLTDEERLEIIDACERAAAAGFTPAVIKTEEENERMLAEIERLMNKGDGASPEELVLLELMSRLVEDFEEGHYPIPEDEPHAVLKHLMGQRGMRPKDLLPVFLSRGHVSDVLSGKRGISKEKAKEPAALFHVSPELFI